MNRKLITKLTQKKEERRQIRNDLNKKWEPTVRKCQGLLEKISKYYKDQHSQQLSHQITIPITLRLQSTVDVFYEKKNGWLALLDEVTRISYMNRFVLMFWHIYGDCKA